MFILFKYDEKYYTYYNFMVNVFMN